jgi:hypothetical protein
LKVPARVKIGSWEYSVEAWESTEAAGSSRFGQCSTNRKTIQIDPLWGRKKAAHTLLHEIMHAISYEWGVMDEDKEERRVTSMADGVACVWHDNPDVMRWIGQGLRQKR